MNSRRIKSIVRYIRNYKHPLRYLAHDIVDRYEVGYDEVVILRALAKTNFVA